MKKMLFLIFLSLFLNLKAGEILPGSVPGSINYQGRLEQDNAPVSGYRNIAFKIYDQEVGGTPLWESSIMTVYVSGGIFSVPFTPDITKLGNAKQLYLEVWVENNPLSPREPIRSVLYSLVAKKLEDGVDIKASTVTIQGGYLRFAAGSGIYFQDGSFQNTSIPLGYTGSATNVSHIASPEIIADSDGNSSGDVIFKSYTIEKMRMLNNGNFGIGTSNPTEKLYVVGNSSVTGNMYLGGIFNNGFIPGANSESIKLGMTNDVISFISGGSEKMRIHSNGNVGINNVSPAYQLDVTGDIYSNSGIKGGDVSIGSFSGWAADSNEIRANADLILQKSNSSGKVGIGLTNPLEKLHVLGSIRANYGIIAATANFSSDVNISGNLNVTGFNKQITLSSTTIYGRLQVYGPVASYYGDPAYVASSNTFTGYNVFSNYIKVSSEAIINYRLGVGMNDFDFTSNNKYLQIGDKDGIDNMDSLLYMVSRNEGNSKIHFYRGDIEAARLETLSGNNLSLSIAGNQKAFVDTSKFKIQSSNFIVSPDGNETTPSIYVNSSNSNVGIKTTNTSHELTVAGSIKLIGDGSAIIFNNGSSLSAAGSGSAESISNNEDAIVRADADANGTGKVILKAGNNIGLIINSNGQVGIGTLDSTSKFQLIGGDMMIGNTSNPLSSNGVEDLIIAGSLIVDGSLQQRSILPVNFSALTVSGNVFLSTSATSTTSIGTDVSYPSYKLYVVGNMNATGYVNGQNGVYTGGVLRIDSSGNIKDSDQSHNLQLPNLTSNDTIVTTALSQTLTNKTLGSGTVIKDSDQSHNVLLPNLLADDTIVTLALSQTLTNKTLGSGTVIKDSDQSHNVLLPNLLADDTIVTLALSQTLTNKTLTSPTIQGTVSGGTGLTMPTFSGSNIYLSGNITASSGTFTQSGANLYSIRTSSGIYVDNGVINMTGGKIVNLADPDANQEAATKAYVDSQIGGGLFTWNRTGNSIGVTDWMGSTNAQDVIFKRNNSEIMRLTSTGISITGSISVTGNVDGVDISAYSPYFIDSAGTSGQVWKSDGSGAGFWGTDNTDDNVSGSELDGVFSSTGLLKRTGAATYTTITDNSINWDTAYSERRQWDGGSTNLDAATGRTSLGLGGGVNASYTVVVDTDPATCQSWTFTNGVLTGVAGTSCP